MHAHTRHVGHESGQSGTVAETFQMAATVSFGINEQRDRKGNDKQKIQIIR